MGTAFLLSTVCPYYTLEVQTEGPGLILREPN